MTSYRLAFLPRPASEWRDLNVRSQSKGSDKTILVIPAEHTLTRWIEVAGRTPQQIRAAALNQMAPDLAQPAADLIVGLGPNIAGKQLVSIAARHKVQAWLANARSRNLKPDAIIPDACLLQRPDNTDATIAHVDNEVLLRTPDAAIACQLGLAQSLLTGKTTVEADFDQQAIIAARADFADCPDLLAALPTARNTSTSSTALPRIAVLAAAALLIAAATPWVQTLRHNAAARDMREQAIQIAGQALPEASRIVNARAQLKEALLPFTAGESHLSLSTALLAELTQFPTITITQLSAEGSEGLRATLLVATPDDFAPLRERLASRNILPEEIVGTPQNGLTPIDILIRPQS